MRFSSNGCKRVDDKWVNVCAPIFTNESTSEPPKKKKRRNKLEARLETMCFLEGLYFGGIITKDFYESEIQKLRNKDESVPLLF